MKFRLNTEYEIDTNKDPYVTEGFRGCLTGTSGSGKSYTAALFIEQWMDQGGVVIIFEPIAEWHTLKAEYPIQVVGGPHSQDIPFIESEPKLYAKAVVEKGISMIFYTRDVENEEDLVKFVYKFTNEIMALQQIHKRPLLFVLEEAHEYAPISSKGHIAPPWVYNRMIKILTDIHTQGRKLNICPLTMTQRPQLLNYTIRQLCNLTMFGKFPAQDAKYLDQNILTYYRKMGYEIKETDLIKLETGQFFVLGSDLRLIQITEKRKTPHGADTPILEYIEPVSEEVQEAISDLGEALKEMLAKRQEEESELSKAKRRVKYLENKVEELNEKVKLGVNLKELLQSANGTVDTARIVKLEKQIRDHKTEKADLLMRIEELETILKESEKIQDQVEKLKEDLGAFEELKAVLSKIFTPKIIEKTIVRQVSSTPKARGKKTPQISTDGKFPWLEIWIPKLKTPQRKVLQVFIDSYPQSMEERQIAMLAGYSPSTGSFKQAVRDLVKWSLLIREGNKYSLNDRPPGT